MDTKDQSRDRFSYDFGAACAHHGGAKFKPRLLQELLRTAGASGGVALEEALFGALQEVARLWAGDREAYLRASGELKQREVTEDRPTEAQERVLRAAAQWWQQHHLKTLILDCDQELRAAVGKLVQRGKVTPGLEPWTCGECGSENRSTERACLACGALGNATMEAKVVERDASLGGAVDAVLIGALALAGDVVDGEDFRTAVHVRIAGAHLHDNSRSVKDAATDVLPLVAAELRHRAIGAWTERTVIVEAREGAGLMGRLLRVVRAARATANVVRYSGLARLTSGPEGPELVAAVAALRPGDVPE